LEVYQFLVETYPEDLNVYDTWGYLPIYYVCLSDAPLEIVQYLLDTHKRISENAVAEIPWQKIVDGFSIMFVSSAVLKAVIHWTIVDRLELVHHAPWKKEIVNAIDLIPGGGRKTWKEKDRQVNIVYNLLSLYELKEVTSILELVAWKSKVDQIQGATNNNSNRHVETSEPKEGTKDEDDAKRLSTATHTTQMSNDHGSVLDRSSISDRSSFVERESNIVERAVTISKTAIAEEGTSKKQDQNLEPSVPVDPNDPEALAIRNNCRINSGAELIISNVIPFCFYPVKLQPWDSEQQQRIWR